MAKKKNDGWEERESGVLIFPGVNYVYAIGKAEKDTLLLLDSGNLRTTLCVASVERAKKIAKLLEP